MRVPIMFCFWGIPDPAAVEGNEVERKFAFREAFKALESRIQLFLSLPISTIDKMRLQERMNVIGQRPLETPKG
jgi:arsenate reductase (thioredoxin)